MDQTKEIPKVLLLQKPNSEEESAAWARLLKALRAFAQPEAKERAETVTVTELQSLTQEWNHVFLDLRLVDLPSFSTLALPNVTLVRKEAFSWHTPDSRKLMLSTLKQYPCLLLEQLPATDFVRIAHLLMAPKRLAGVVPLMEKGALILGEKVQSLDNIGTLLDKLGLYLERLEGFTLGSRVNDLRQVLSASLHEAMRQAQKVEANYPTVSFQVGASKNKLVVNMRFPRGDLPTEDLALLALDGRNLYWQQMWLCGDLMMVTHHTQYDEIELMFMIGSAGARNLQQFRSFLFRTSERSNKKENLLAPPQNYDFHVLSELRLKEQQAVATDLDENLGDIDFGSLPESVVKKIAKLSEECTYYKESAEKRSAVTKSLQETLAHQGKELNKKRNDIIRLMKAAETQNERAHKKISELEKRIEQLAAVATQGNANKDNGAAALLQANVTKLEIALRAAENEKVQLNEKALNEAKKVTVYENKYSALYKELSSKDKEIGELKSNLLKLKKEKSTKSNDANPSAAASAATEGLAAKLKETEAREAALKQELRKISFKMENHEKNVKAIQSEALEKSKLMEQKLQGAKTKELELMKKIEELSGALKKASKAA